LQNTNPFFSNSEEKNIKAFSLDAILDQQHEQEEQQTRREVCIFHVEGHFSTPDELSNSKIVLLRVKQ
jgi:hypothetical protein